MIGQAAEFGQLDDVALHAEHAVHHDELARFRIEFSGGGFPGRPCPCGRTARTRPGKLAALDDAGVIALVGQNEIAFSDQRADDAQIDLETGAVKQHRLLVHQPGEGLLQFQVDVQRPVQEARTSAAGAVSVDRGFGRLLDFRDGWSAEVAVRPEHQDLPAVDDDLAVLGRGNGAEVGVQPRRANLVGALVIPGFVEQGKRQRSGFRTQKRFPVVDNVRASRT